ncbi:penicillin-binding protein [Aspergillus costaricaensis CBS 115574]|uniref:Penicillin-binding protein n=1 Tax=Aspergillus costaricaensis CBS 115574 TaxID=1448317 RepID=A0ACD1IGD3_9EURO|nr:penicillin-binding protein [Aspergillus costaricaensis CBS 115574]RAK89625.1 penicillin-binding protein [Aspergillus costaricaensis CBS 115574]
MDEEDVLDLGCQVLPWISNQVILIGQQTRNNAYGTLGCELFVLSQQIPAISETTLARQRLLKIFKIVDKACSTSRNEADRFQALGRIRSYKDSTSNIRQTVIRETQESLTHFVRHSPEYNALLRLISDCFTVDETEPVYAEECQDDNDIGYSGYLNQVLYTQLQTYAKCGCRTVHLESTRLRLSTDNHICDDDVSFELAFKARPFPPTNTPSFVQWKASIVKVPRQTNVQKSKKKVGFASTYGSLLSSNRNSSLLSQRLRRLERGEFCKLIDNRLGRPVQFCIQSNVLQVIEPPDPKPPRGIRPFEGLSLGKWLGQIPHLSNKGKSHLAYTVAKSVWQYYNSPWMMVPWTHESIQLLIEETGLADQGKPHPYLTANMARAVVTSTDCYNADNLMHQYPYILALGVLLIEIAIKQPLTSEECPHPFSKSVVNDYYTWAWTTAHRSKLKDMVHYMYEEAVNNCLNPELFGGDSIQQYGDTQQVLARQNVLYEKIVLPLKRLSEAYQDDWGIQTAPTAKTLGTVAHHVISETFIASQFPHKADFTVAIFCALPLEVNAVSALFDDRFEDFSLYQNSPGDSNTYTLGRMGRHNTALVHLPGMGKSVASQASSSIRSTYPNIKLALVVGICGGVPYGKGSKEILLGDVVVSDGIIQHDFGRRIPGAFLPKASVADGLGRPNVAIRGFLSKVKTTWVQRHVSNRMTEYMGAINKMLGNDTARYPGVEQDELYEPSYQHKHRSSTSCIRCADSTNTTVCSEVFDLSCHELGCGKDNLVKRKRLQAALTQGHTPSPAIHLGLIASGDTVMKSGQDRDLIAERHNVIAFEMEGAGVWDSLPCLVVKGVCDYADSHKNKIQAESSAMVLRQESNPLTLEFDALVDKLLEEWHIPGLTVSVVHGSSTYAKAYGYASFPSTPMTTTSLFTTCSTTKAFTADAMSLAIDDSQSTPHPISWSTPVSSIIRDDFVLSTPSATTNTTIEDILSHRSGLPGHFFSINLAFPNETLRTEVRRLRWLPLAFPPRTTFNYNNHMFMAATYLLEHINGESLGTTLKRRIWDPLDMNDTYFSTAEVQKHQNLSKRLVKGYTWNPETHTYYEEQYINYAPITGTGSMVSNVMDYAKWLRAMLYQAPPISKEGHTALRIPRTVIAESDWKNMLAPPGAYHLYTMGWFIDYYHGEQLYWHTGSWVGFGIMVGFLPAKGFAFAMMGNTQNARIAELDLFLYLIDQLLGKSGAERETHVRKLGAKLKEMERMYNESVECVVARLYPDLKMRLPHSLSLGAYTGTYAHPGYGEFEVCEKSGKLVVDLRDRVGSCSMRFEHVSGEFFVVKYYNPEAEAVGPDYTKAEFYVDEQGVPKSLGLDLESVLGEKIWFRRME